MMGLNPPVAAEAAVENRRWPGREGAGVQAGTTQTVGGISSADAARRPTNAQGVATPPELETSPKLFLTRGRGQLGSGELFERIFLRLNDRSFGHGDHLLQARHFGNAAFFITAGARMSARCTVTGSAGGKEGPPGVCRLGTGC